MQISGPGIPPLFRLSLTASSLKAMPLHDGDTVTATVLGSNTSGKLNLDINGKLLQVVSTLRLTAGMTLQLRVEKSNDQLLLHLDDKTVQQLTRNQALRQSLPVQEPLKPLFERLQQLVSQTARTATAKAESAGAEVTTPSPGSVAAKATATPTALTATAPTTHDKAATADRQGGVAKSAASPLANITKASQGESAQALPRQVQQAIERLLAVLPLLKQVSGADGLKQAIASSGLFLESSLLHAQHNNLADKDVKTALLRLARTIRQRLATEGGEQHAEVTRSRDMLQGLLRQIDAGLARIQLHQLSSLTSQQSQGDERQLLTLELPLLQPQGKGIELLQLKIQREKAKRGSGAEDCWSVTLHLSPAGYGDIQAVVSLSSGKVSTTFWCQEEQTGKLFRQQLDELQQRLSEQGLEVGRCTAITGSAPESLSPATRTESSGLIDTRA